MYVRTFNFKRNNSSKEHPSQSWNVVSVVCVPCVDKCTKHPTACRMATEAKAMVKASALSRYRFCQGVRPQMQVGVSCLDTDIGSVMAFLLRLKPVWK